MRGPTRARAIAIAAAAVAAGDAHGHGRIDAVEHIFGATNVHAVTGHGRLSVGISADGDITVLTWPNPSQADQVAYLSSNAFDARDRPRFGAPEGAGVFLGLVLERADGTRAVTWLRDRATWTIAQSYGADDGPNVETRHEAPALGLTVTVTDAVRPPPAPDAAGDLYIRHVRVERAPGADIAPAWLLTYANLSPTPPSSRIPELPVADRAFDGRNDFAAVWDPSIDGVVHFHPGDQLIRDDVLDLVGTPAVDYGPIGEALAAGAPDAAALAARLDADYAPGAYLALTTRPAPDQHQVGADATPWCDAADAFIDNLVRLPERFPALSLPVDPALLDGVCCDRDAPSLAERQGWVELPADALRDAADGTLEGADLAAGEVNAALRTPLTLDADGVAEAALLIAAGPDAATARATLAGAPPAAQVIAEAEAALDEWLAGRALPESAPPAVRAVARRSLINLRVGTVAANGAIVASIARQAPYGLDWPRDGAFFNVALDVAGLPDLVERRVDLYLAWQRRRPVRATPIVDPPPPPDPDGGPAVYPAGAWEMNYYADGAPGGVFRFEIDNTAFALWTIVAHVGWVPPERAEAYLRDRWAGIRAAADLLTRWRDPETGLHAPAQEDDNAPYVQTLHGAVTVFGALDLAARAARFLGEDADAARWERRAAEVRRAIETLLYDPAAERFVARPGEAFDPRRAPTGPTAWLVWPMHLLPWDDPRVDAQLRGDLALITPRIELETAGGAYFMKNTVSLALARGADPAWRPRLAALLERLAAHATPGTRHFGEVMMVVEGPRADQRVSTPHLWEGILFYLTAMAMEDPARLLRYDRVLPPSCAGRAPEPDAGVPGPDAGALDAGMPDATRAGDAAGAGDAAEATDVAAPPDDAGATGQGAAGGCDCDVAGGPPGALAPLLVALYAVRRRRG